MFFFIMQFFLTLWVYLFDFVVLAFARPDIRVRIRGGVIRVRVSEARFRAVIRITAEMNTTLYATNLFFLSIQNKSGCPRSVGSLSEGTLSIPESSEGYTRCPVTP